MYNSAFLSNHVTEYHSGVRDSNKYFLNLLGDIPVDFLKTLLK